MWLIIGIAVSISLIGFAYAIRHAVSDDYKADEETGMSVDSEGHLIETTTLKIHV